MGTCLSSESDGSTRHRKPSANVVSDSGELRQYFLPVTASEVLESQTSSPDSFFLCNSDGLYFDDFIPPLDPHEELQPAQIYFLFPTSKLKYRLAAPDMAALAIKASAALEQINGRRKRKTRISPVLVTEEDPQSNHTVSYRINNTTTTSGNYHSKPSAPSRSGSMKKLTRYSSRRAKLAIRSFKTKLTTIHEGSSVLPN